MLFLCPQCHKGKLFSGLLHLNAACPQCELDFNKHDTGDGPVFLVITFLGFAITGLAVWAELTYQPAFWLHAAIWFPAILILTPLLLRITKARMVHYHFQLSQKEQL